MADETKIDRYLFTLYAKFRKTVISQCLYRRRKNERLSSDFSREQNRKNFNPCDKVLLALAGFAKLRIPFDISSGADMQI
jgi:hypothetical protein